VADPALQVENLARQTCRLGQRGRLILFSGLRLRAVGLLPSVARFCGLVLSRTNLIYSGVGDSKVCRSHESGSPRRARAPGARWAPPPRWAGWEPPRANRALEMLRGRTSARQPHVGRLDSVTYLWGSRAVVTSSTAPDVHATREGCIVTASGAPVILG